MSYMHIDNLYKNQEILMFKECYAMEKIHGTSAHIWFFKHPEREIDPYGTIEKESYSIRYSSGGEKHERFITLFDEVKLLNKFKELNISELTIYGEAYGGKQQGMSDTYGKELKFIAFEVKIEHSWLSVPKAAEFVKQFGLDFVYYWKTETNIDMLNDLRDLPSPQANLNGMGIKKMEGIVLRPLIELKKNNGARIIVKHKREDFRETKTKREINPDKLKVLREAKAVTEEWVTEMRLSHVLDNFPNIDIAQIGKIIKAMIEDIKRESEKEVVWSREVQKEISKACAIMFKQRLKDKLNAS